MGDTGADDMGVSGGCRCGAIRYEARGAPHHASLCHCADCRRSAGAHAVGWMLFDADALTITGDPVTYRSSELARRQFCGTCGTGLFYLNETIFPGRIDVQLATLDDVDAIAPQGCIQMAEAPRWAATIPELPAFARFPEG